MDRDLMLAELHEALRSVENGWVPGIDGLLVEFHKAFWAVIGEDVLDVLQNIVNGSQLLLSWRWAILTLLP